MMLMYCNMTLVWNLVIYYLLNMLSVVIVFDLLCSLVVLFVLLVVWVVFVLGDI